MLRRFAGNACGGDRRGRAQHQSLVLFPVLAAASFTEPLRFEGLPSDGAPAHLQRKLLRRLEGSDAQLHIAALGPLPPSEPGATISMRDFVALCRQHFTFSQAAPAPMVTEMWAPIAEPLLRGFWPCDFAPLALRTPASMAHRLIPGLPSRKAVLDHLAVVADNAMPERPGEQQTTPAPDVSQSRHRYGDDTDKMPHGASQFDILHMIRAIRASASHRSLADLQQNVEEIVSFALPDQAPVVQSALSRGDLVVPSRWSLARARVHLDIASMLLARRRHRSPRHSVARYLVYDASPKNGLEIFAVKEMCVADHNLAEASWRHLPLSTLGSGHASAVDKVACIMHAIFLVSGPRESDMRRWARQVRWCLGDCGAELLAADTPDLISEFMQSRFGDEELSIGGLAGRGLLFPLAMRGAGWNHLIDLIVKETSLKHIPFFEEWLRKARILCNFLRVQAYREKLITLGKKAGADLAHLKGLQVFSASFATWRWGTLRHVCSSLSSAQQGLRGSWTPIAFRLKDSSLSATVSEVVGQDFFWEQTDALLRWSSDMEELRTWAMGCPCRESQCMEASLKRTVFHCPHNRKGCRAPEVSEKLQQTWGRMGGSLGPSLGDPVGDRGLECHHERRLQAEHRGGQVALRLGARAPLDRLGVPGEGRGSSSARDLPGTVLCVLGAGGTVSDAVWGSLGLWSLSQSVVPFSENPHCAIEAGGAKAVLQALPAWMSGLLRCSFGGPCRRGEGGGYESSGARFVPKKYRQRQPGGVTHRDLGDTRWPSRGFSGLHAVAAPTRCSEAARASNTGAARQLQQRREQDEQGGLALLRQSWRVQKAHGRLHRRLPDGRRVECRARRL